VKINYGIIFMNDILGEYIVIILREVSEMLLTFNKLFDIFTVVVGTINLSQKSVFRFTASHHI
jgi:hypothetical protein